MDVVHLPVVTTCGVTLAARPDLVAELRGTMVASRDGKLVDDL